MNEAPVGHRAGRRLHPGRGVATGWPRSSTPGPATVLPTCAPLPAARPPPLAPPACVVAAVDINPMRAGLVRRQRRAAAAPTPSRRWSPTAAVRRCARHVRPRAGRRAVLRPRRPAPPPRRPLAHPARRRRPTSPRCSASCSTPPSTSLKPGGTARLQRVHADHGRDGRHRRVAGRHPARRHGGRSAARRRGSRSDGAPGSCRRRPAPTACTSCAFAGAPLESARHGRPHRPVHPLGRLRRPGRRHRRRRAEADLLHVDVMDGHFVPNLTIGPPVVKSLRKHTDLYLDCHLMMTNPASTWRRSRRRAPTGARCTSRSAAPTSSSTRCATSASTSAWPSTPTRRSRRTSRGSTSIDLLLLMTVFPGFGGQKFMAEVMPKVERGPRRDRPRAASTSPSRSTAASTSSTAPVAAAAGADRLRRGQRHLRRRRPRRRRPRASGTPPQHDPLLREPPSRSGHRGLGRQAGRRCREPVAAVVGGCVMRAKVLTVSDGVVAGTREDSRATPSPPHLDQGGLRGRGARGGGRRHRRRWPQPWSDWPTASPAWW